MEYVKGFFSICGSILGFIWDILVWIFDFIWDLILILDLPWWGWLIVIVILSLIFGGGSGGSSKSNNNFKEPVVNEPTIKEPKIEEPVVKERVDYGYLIDMSAEELKYEFGEPEDIDSKVLKTKKKEVWKYFETRKGQYDLKIILENDIVVGYEQK